MEILKSLRGIKCCYNTVAVVVVLVLCTLDLAQGFAVYPREFYADESDILPVALDSDLFQREVRSRSSASNLESYWKNKVASFRKRGQYDALIAELSKIHGDGYVDVRNTPFRFGPGGKKK